MSGTELKSDNCSKFMKGTSHKLKQLLLSLNSFHIKILQKTKLPTNKGTYKKLFSFTYYQEKHSEPIALLISGL